MFALGLILLASTAGAISAPSMLWVENMHQDSESTFLIDRSDPRFGFVPSVPTNAFEIVVKDELGKVSWDSGQVLSTASNNIVYNGSALRVDTNYTWSVRIWGDLSADPSDFSSPAWFLVGPGQASDWVAGWIACDQSAESNGSASPLNRLQAAFEVGEKVERALAYVSGVGYHRLFVNGSLVEATALGLDPAWTAYRQRSLYVAYDVTGYLTGVGQTTVGVELGNGWADVGPTPYNGSSEMKDLERSPYTKSSYQWSRTGSIRRVILQLHILLANGTRLRVLSAAPNARTPMFLGPARPGTLPPAVAESATDIFPTWWCNRGPRLDDSVYDGIVYDQREEDPNWASVSTFLQTLYSTDNRPQNIPVSDNHPQNIPVSDNHPQNIPVSDNQHPPRFSKYLEPAVAAPPFAANATLTATSSPLTGALGPPEPPVNVSSPRAGEWVFDFGYNAAGVVRLQLPGGVPVNTTLKLRHAEILWHEPYGPANGSVYTANLRSARATDIFTGSGEPIDFTPYFTFHGFRYVQLEGLPLDIVPNASTLQAIRLAALLQPRSTFESSSSLLSGIFGLATRGQLSNLRTGGPSDSPQRDERRFWMGDAGLSSRSFLQNHFSAPVLLNTWALSILDDQNNPFDAPANTNGSVSDTAPHTMGSKPGDPNWMSAYPTLLMEGLRLDAAADVVERHYDSLQRYGDFLEQTFAAQGAAHLYNRYNDWVPPPPKPGGGQGPKPPGSLVSSFALVRDFTSLERMALVLGRSEDAQRWQELAEIVTRELNNAFLNTSTGIYGNGDGLQTAHACALTANVTPPDSIPLVAANLVHSVFTDRLSTGILGTRCLFSALVQVRRADVALGLLLDEAYPSYGFMLRNAIEPARGSMWELWDTPYGDPGMDSRAHHAFSDVSSTLVELVAGISQTTASIGFAYPYVAPQMTAGPLSSAAASLWTPYGTLTASWVNSSDAVCAEAEENDLASLDCGGMGTIDNITFASFGTPIGVCGSFATSVCNAPNSTTIVESLCLGRASCTVNCTDQLFGDPCHHTAKRLYIQATCRQTSQAHFALNTSIPAVRNATVAVPLGRGSTITEAGTIVWNAGKFSPAPGISAATLVHGAVQFTVAQGNYTFQVAD